LPVKALCQAIKMTQSFTVWVQIGAVITSSIYEISSLVSTWRWCSDCRSNRLQTVCIKNIFLPHLALVFRLALQSMSGHCINKSFWCSINVCDHCQPLDVFEMYDFTFHIICWFTFCQQLAMAFPNKNQRKTFY
jgi:hypothetical protein